ncbi:MAG: DJ-1 family glyoxalase III [Sphaerochaetaceae bacterium]
MKKVLIILADGFEDMEAITPIDLLRRCAVSVTVAGLGKKIILSSHKLTVVCDTTLEGCMRFEYDAIILPGGGLGSKNLSESYEVIQKSVEMFNQGKVVAAICAAPSVVLGKTGILEGKHVTCYPGTEQNCPEIAFDHTLKVIVDDNLITAAGAGAAVDFSLALIARLLDKETADELAGKIIY